MGMGNGIFDWDDEEEKREEERPPAFQQPIESASYWPENATEPEPWNDPWSETAAERQWEQQPIEYVPYQPESADETVRRGGLAWSAGIVFFSSIVFMLFIGWGADWIFQSSPWGIVSGIVIGSILGFIQFFRISSQIFGPSKSKSSIRPLMPRDDEDRYR